MRAYEKPVINIQFRVTAALVLVLTCFSVLVLRLWYLQILKGDYFRVLSENNRRKIVFIPPPRGLISDRKGEVIVKNRPAFNVEFVPEDSSLPDETLSTLARVLGYEPKEFMMRVKQQRQRRRYEPKIVLKDVDREVVAKVVVHGYELPGVVIRYYPARQYLYGSSAAHILGYIREISRGQLESSEYAGYRLGDLVGQFGIEKRWERELQGQRGQLEIVVNAGGIRTQDLSYEEEHPGHNIKLTIDLAAQRAADHALSEKSGAIVAVAAKTGEILAMSSSPRYDPNIFTKEVSPQIWSRLIAGEDQPMNNRAVQGVYPPGSVFKVFMAIAGLSEGVIGKNDHIFCPGHYFFGGRAYHCHKRSGHGSVAMYDALVQSCDVYFYTVGQRLGVDRINEYATRFGLGKRTKLDLVEENPGLIPSTQWKKEYFKGTEEERWWPGETLSVAIGQGATLVTPLQLALGVAAVVNGGKVNQPWLVREVNSVDGSYRDTDFHSENVSSIEIDKGILKAVREAMVGVVNDPRGTARRAKLPEEMKITVGGKTGTSQVVSLAYHKKDSEFDHHAWFVGFAPAEDPEIVVSALIEHGGGGGLAAAPAVEEVLEAYFKGTFEPKTETPPGQAEKPPAPSVKPPAPAEKPPQPPVEKPPVQIVTQPD